MAKLTNHVKRTRLITSSTDKHYSLDSEDYSAQVVEMSVTNNSSFQNYPHPHVHTKRTTDNTPGFKPFTILEFDKHVSANAHYVKFTLMMTILQL